jgi:hypothetical protein
VTRQKVEGRARQAEVGRTCSGAKSEAISTEFSSVVATEMLHGTLRTGTNGVGKARVL